MTKSSRRSTAVTTPAFGAALHRARKRMDLETFELAAILNVAARTLARWEAGPGMPSHDYRPPLLRWLATIPRSHAEPVLRELGVLLPDAPIGAEITKDAELTKMVLEHALLLAAETHDLAPRALRASVLAVLDAAQRAHVSLGTARTLLAGPAPAK
jgi:DNA-binding transcriptional regulator YiaG